MADLLLTAARRLGIQTSASAGPGGVESAQIWASWPRQRSDIAHDTLNRTLALGTDCCLEPLGDANLWRARSGDWSFVGAFEDAVAMLALHAIEAADDAPPQICS